MTYKFAKVISTILMAATFLLVFQSRAHAGWVCNGSIRCCTANWHYDCNGQPCDQFTNPGCVGCTQVCDQESNNPCYFSGGACNIHVPDSICNYQISGSCWSTCNPDCVGKVCGEADGCGGSCPSTGFTNWSGWSCGACTNPGGCGNVTWTQTCTRTNQCNQTETTNNGCNTSCNECGPHYGPWSACTAPSFTRSRSVSYDCQAGTTQTETCYGSVTGTLFDASTVNDCSTIDIQPKVVGATVNLTALTNQTNATYSATTDINGNYTRGSLLVPDDYGLSWLVDTTKWVATPPKLLCDGFLSPISLRGCPKSLNIERDDVP